MRCELDITKAYGRLRGVMRKHKEAYLGQGFPLSHYLSKRAELLN